MPHAIKVLLCTGFLACLATVAAANPVEQIFTQANVVGQRTAHDVQYLLPLGRVKDDRKAGRAQPAKFERLQGNLAAVTWKLEGALSLQDARQLVLTYLERQKADLLFECSGRDCGESALWANGVFAQPLLFGSDRAQHLWAIRDRDVSRYHVLYLVERPNRRLYFHEETLTVPAGMVSADDAKAALKAVGRVLLGGVPLVDNVPDFSVVAQKVKDWQVATGLDPVLVIHRHGDAAALPPMQTQLTAALASLGIQARVEDIGPLAPHLDAPGLVWVEWINPQWAPGAE